MIIIMTSHDDHYIHDDDQLSIAPYVHKWEGGGKFHPVLIYYVMVKIILGTLL